MTKIMLTVRTRSVADDVISQLQDLPVEFFAATAVTEAQDILAREHLDHAILGGGPSNPDWQSYGPSSSPATRPPST